MIYSEYSQLTLALMFDAHLHIGLNMPVLSKFPFVPGSPMQTEEVDKVLARLQCSHGLAMFLTWKGVMRNCGIRRVVRILLRRGHFSDGEGHHWKNAENCGKIRHFCACIFAIFPPRRGTFTHVPPLATHLCGMRHGIQISVKNVRFTLLDIITLAY